MPAILTTAARQMNADTAGLTHVATGPPPGAPESITPAEVFAQYPNESGELAGLFTEQLPALVSTAVEKPTNALAGALGGLNPANHAPATEPGPGTSPGPVGAPEAPKTGATVEQVRATATTALGRVRRALGI